MKILHLSDTHNCHRRLGDLPEADVVEHSGDFCMVGTEKEALDFLHWFCDLSVIRLSSEATMTTVFIEPISADLTTMALPV